MINEGILTGTLAGLVGAEIVNKEIFENRTVYISGVRIHHWQLGAALMALGSIFAIISEDRNSRKVGIVVASTGFGVFLHDYDDFAEWLNEVNMR